MGGCGGWVARSQEVRRSRNKNTNVLGVSSNMKSISPGMMAGVEVEAGAEVEGVRQSPCGAVHKCRRPGSRWERHRCMLCF